MGVREEVTSIRRKYHALRNARTQKRNADRKKLNFDQKEEREALSKRQREDDRALQEAYESEYHELGAKELDELEGVQR